MAGTGVIKVDKIVVRTGLAVVTVHYQVDGEAKIMDLTYRQLHDLVAYYDKEVAEVVQAVQKVIVEADFTGPYGWSSPRRIRS